MLFTILALSLILITTALLVPILHRKRVLLTTQREPRMPRLSDARTRYYVTDEELVELMSKRGANDTFGPPRPVIDRQALLDRHCPSLRYADIVTAAYRNLNDLHRPGTIEGSRGDKGHGDRGETPK